ncbi:zinc ABC transporter substrate-binding protein [Ureibacillus sp. FSL K6-8385]|uniref:Adhesin n=1 Tax=Ureibacillus terrenus TaxID=118246 RepID=A0A540V0F2_9BACL|nr:zinc ABC transporter substrate-binding protein [Ureibacillus terrenus]MED3662559.1 zinc ABC transporter substrate-binding protein [Ureibacillus terrenus]MED3764864.1 zinc ABC transporter substrate-binding protein [Ureibacillus terrenus]TQE90157.1 adhesin [Ureibacillus terrenus]
MKKLLLLSLLTFALFLTACSNTESKQRKDGQIDIYTTVYPLQFFAEQIGGEYVNVSSIYPPGSNEHTFEPTQKDMIALADADLFFYIGLGLEGFVENAKKSLANEHVKFVAVGENIDEEKLKTSTGHSHEEAGGHDHGHHHGNVDPHVWLSPVISKELALTIKEELVQQLPEQEETFNKNYERLAKRLDELDQQLKELANNASKKIFFVSHASFGYIAGNYGLTQVPIAGLNSQSEPSQKELAEIAGLAKQYDVHYILFEQNVSSKLSSIIQKEIGAEALMLHNLSVLTEDDIKNKEDYFTLMEKNIKTLEKALN